MCGIVGIIGKKEAAPQLLEGLKRLEYRGYDSAGIATLDNGKIDRRRAEGKIINLDQRLTEKPLAGVIGIGHTRWATHGLPNETNAHPHATDKVAVVHNGIIENYNELKEELTSYQVHFESETDTEVVVQLVNHYLTQGMSPFDAANTTFDRLQGAYSLALIFAGEDNLMIGARQGTPLAVGYGDGEMYLASDSYALAPFTNKICFLEDGDRVTMTRDSVRIYTSTNDNIDRPIRVTAQSGAVTGKGNYPHFMLKEIYEQPAVIGDTLNAYINPANGVVSLPPEVMALANTPRVTIVACGTAYYAGSVAKYWLEQVARIPVELDIASEFRYREAPMPEGGVALFISQSGETLDTLEALRYAKSQGQTILSIINTIESTIERESDHVLHTLAGPEIGVASTKAFTTQLTTLACLAVAWAHEKGAIDAKRAGELGEALRHIPTVATQILNHDETIKSFSKDVAQARDVLYLGRGGLFPLAMEGALKLKEISYIHAEGYPAGELKHGPLALVDEQMPVVCVAPSDDLLEKVKSNLQEVRARGGQLIVFTDRQAAFGESDDVRLVLLPSIDPVIAPIAYVVPLQLLAYHVAVLRGTDVDQPRNLAKSVTVE